MLLLTFQKPIFTRPLTAFDNDVELKYQRDYRLVKLDALTYFTNVAKKQMAYRSEIIQNIRKEIFRVTNEITILKGEML